ncbi:MAG: XRE family transcriptional regulator [Planctomycetota bacterium]|nr:XRE family transcriptional regulator [Planctomycetota bacterium]
MRSGEDVILSPGRRLRESRKRMGLTQAELAEKSGVSQAAISQIEKGTSRGSEAVWLKLARALRVPPEEFNVSPALAGEVIRLPLFDEIPLRGAKASARKMVTVTPDQYGPTRYVLRVNGVSMYPRIHSGDCLLVERCHIVLPRLRRERKWREIGPLRDMHGRIVVALLNGQPFLKRIEVRHESGGLCRIVLVSDNPEIPPRFVRRDEELRIVGRVLEIWARC